jgi:hypothetical protein
MAFGQKQNKKVGKENNQTANTNSILILIKRQNYKLFLAFCFFD